MFATTPPSCWRSFAVSYSPPKTLPWKVTLMAFWVCHEDPSEAPWQDDLYIDVIGVEFLLNFWKLSTTFGCWFLLWSIVDQNTGFILQRWVCSGCWFAMRPWRSTLQKSTTGEFSLWHVRYGLDSDWFDMNSRWLLYQACFGGTLFGMDIGIIGGVLTLSDFKTWDSCVDMILQCSGWLILLSEFGIDHLNPLAASNLSANLVSVMQAGAIAGALAANPLVDKIGRKPGLMVVSVFAFIGGILQAVSFGSFVCFYIGRSVSSYSLIKYLSTNSHFRFVEGLGLGGATMVAPTYVAENAPRAIRGLLVGFYQLFETMGAMVAFFINYGSLLHIKVRSSQRNNRTDTNISEIGSCILASTISHAITSTIPPLHQHFLLSRKPSMVGQAR